MRFLHLVHDHMQPEQLSEFPEFCFCERLGKDVGNIVSGWNVSDHDFSVLNHFMNEVVAHVNVFCVRMKFFILSECDCSLIIAIRINGSSGAERSSCRKLCSHSASLATCVCAMYSASVLDSATTCCFFKLHEMAPAPM